MSHTDIYVCDGVMVINNKRQGHLFQNMEGSIYVELLATYRLIDLWSSIS